MTKDQMAKEAKEAQIKYIKTEELIPYVNNPRTNDQAVDSVAASIKEFGFKQPIVIDKDKVVVAGHTRLKASKKLGLEEVPCIIADDLTEEQIKAYRLADNKVAESADWDLQKLEIELKALEDVDMSQFGFEEMEKEAQELSRNHDDEDDEFDDIEKLDKHYGVPYQGNKSRIADIIINLLPGGGGSSTSSEAEEQSLTADY